MDGPAAIQTWAETVFWVIVISIVAGIVLTVVSTVIFSVVEKVIFGEAEVGSEIIFDRVRSQVPWRFSS